MKRILYCLFLLFLSLPLVAQEYTQLTNLPTVYIETKNKAAVTSKKDFVNATWKMVDGDQVVTLSDMKIRCRGNSTFSGSNATKKAYRVKFSEKVSLLGDKGVADKNWVLMANHYDKSLIRNALTTDIMGRFAGMEFNPGALFVDVVLNGNYIGNYQITDHPDVESGRLDIETPGDDAEASEGFFLEADGWKDHKYVTTTLKSVPVRIHKPKDGEVTTAQSNYVKSWLDRFESALFSKDYKDPELGYRKLVDSVSLANLYLCTEMSANYDGFWSTYLFKRPNDQKMYFGPLWDYDIAYNNDTRGNNTTERMIVDINTGVCRSWFTRMWRDPWFRQLILRRYRELRDAGIEAHLQHAVDSLGNLLAASAKLNFDKYGINTKVYNEVAIHDTYAEYITDLKDFLTQHFAYLDHEIVERANATYEDDAREFELNVNYYYRVQSVGVKTLFDVVDEGLKDGNFTCLWAADTVRWTQQWAIKQVGDAYQFINRASGLALNAPSGDLSTRLNIVEPNAEDEAQLWNIVLASDESSYYNIINKKYQRTANVEGGSSTSGTSLIAWESNEKNTTSLNRQWIITPADFNSDEVWNIGDIYEVLSTEITKYEELMAGESVGDEIGQVSKAKMDKLSAIISDAKDVVEQGKLNVNLTHTYIYYMERAWKAVEDSRIVADPINFEAEGNYHLFMTADGAEKATADAAFLQNTDTPWGFYRYAVEDGTYEKFQILDANSSKAKPANGDAWYSNDEYVFISENGNCHSLPAASPAIMFTAPADGIYFATVTIHRDKSGVNTPLYLRSRYIEGEEKQCNKNNFIFAKGYGTPDIDGEDGKVPQTLDFFIRMRQGASFTIEIENYTANTDASGRSFFTDLAVASCRDTDKPFTLKEAKSYVRFYDAIGQEPINFAAEGNFQLFMTADGAEKATADAAFLQNTDTPWGFYRYSVEDGTYEKFQILDANSSKAKPANGDAWYSNDEYVFISENGNCHSLPAASPAIMFTAPADGIYFATVTIHRDKSGVNTPLYLRSRYIEGEEKQCSKDEYLFAKAYGTPAIDEADGKVPQTLDFFIRMKQGASFTIEIENYTANTDASGRSFFTNLAVASCRDTDKPFTLEDAQAYDRFYDAMAEVVVPINFDAEGNYHLFQTAEGASAATADAAFEKNDDQPWGYYRYTPSDGEYAKFTTFDDQNSKAKAANGRAWYSNSEYCFVTENGNIHPLASSSNGTASPAIAFTAPADGIYFATMTVFRDKSGQTNTLNLRSRIMKGRGMKCDQGDFLFAQPYGTVEVDEVDGKVPQTLDFFIKLREGQTFTFEVDATDDTSGRSHIADLAVASCRDKDLPFTEAEAQAYDRFFDATKLPVTYNLTYIVDGVEYKTAEVEVGATIIPEQAPEKEGYTFSGWSEIPETMPAEDVTVTGSFSVNKYKVSYYVGEQLVFEDEVEYGAALTLRTYTPEDASRYSFIGWDGETYETMPAHDIVYRALIADGLGHLIAGNSIKAIFDGSGRQLIRLQRGINIIQMHDGTLRKVVR